RLMTLGPFSHAVGIHGIRLPTTACEAAHAVARCGFVRFEVNEPMRGYSLATLARLLIPLVALAAQCSMAASSRARMSSPSVRAAVRGDNAEKSGAAVVPVGEGLSGVDWKMKHARMSSPSTSAAVTGDKTTGGSVLVTPLGVSAVA